MTNRPSILQQLSAQQWLCVTHVKKSSPHNPFVTGHATPSTNPPQTQPTFSSIPTPPPTPWSQATPPPHHHKRVMSSSCHPRRDQACEAAAAAVEAVEARAEHAAARGREEERDGVGEEAARAASK